MKTRWWVAALVMSLTTLGTAPGDIPAHERAALIVLYNATGGATWEHNDRWLEEPGTENQWYGVRVENDHVVRIALSELSGSLPDSWAALSELQELILGGTLTGSIPDTLGSLTKLTRLRLAGLTGEIPPSLGGLSSLAELDLGGNELEGEVPAALGNLTSLEFLYLQENHFTGTLPASLGNLGNLRRLDVSGNLLSGPIPPELANLTNLWVSSSMSWNYLSTTNQALRTFLDEKFGDWYFHQVTPPPLGSTIPVDGSRVQIRWREPPCDAAPAVDGHHFRISYGTTAGGPYPNTGVTTNNGLRARDLILNGLDRFTDYYGVIQTVVAPFTSYPASNPHTLVSAPGAEFSFQAIRSDADADGVFDDQDDGPDSQVEAPFSGPLEDLVDAYGCTPNQNLRDLLFLYEQLELTGRPSFADSDINGPLANFAQSWHLFWDAVWQPRMENHAIGYVDGKKQSVVCDPEGGISCVDYQAAILRWLWALQKSSRVIEEIIPLRPGSETRTYRDIFNGLDFCRMWGWDPLTAAAGHEAVGVYFSGRHWTNGVVLDPWFTQRTTWYPASEWADKVRFPGAYDAQLHPVHSVEVKRKWDSIMLGRQVTGLLACEVDWLITDTTTGGRLGYQGGSLYREINGSQVAGVADSHNPDDIAWCFSLPEGDYAMAITGLTNTTFDLRLNYMDGMVRHYGTNGLATGESATLALDTSVPSTPLVLPDLSEVDPVPVPLDTGFQTAFAGGLDGAWLDFGNGCWSTTNGVCRMSGTGGNRNRWLLYEHIYRGLDARADVRCNAGDPAAWHGLLFRHSTSRHDGYALLISTEGRYTVERWQYGGWIRETLQQPTTHAALRTGLGQWNTLRVRCFEDELELYINGQWVTTIQDSELEQGMVGFAAYDDAPGDEVDFDNFEVRHVLVDADLDGMPDAFEIQHFGGTNEVHGGPLDDWDGDGLPNAAESVAGTDPTNSLSHVLIQNVEMTGTDLQIRLDTRTNRLYWVEQATNSVDRAWNMLTNAMEGTGGPSALTITPGTTQSLYRIGVDRFD